MGRGEAGPRGRRRAGAERSGGSRVGLSGYGRSGGLLCRYDVGLGLGEQLPFDVDLAALRGPDPFGVREGNGDAGLRSSRFLAEPVPVGERVVSGLLKSAETVLQAGDQSLSVSLGQLRGSEQ